MSEGDSSQLDTQPAPPDCRDAETITGICESQLSGNQEETVKILVYSKFECHHCVFINSRIVEMCPQLKKTLKCPGTAFKKVNKCIMKKVLNWNYNFFFPLVFYISK